MTSTNEGAAAVSAVATAIKKARDESTGLEQPFKSTDYPLFITQEGELPKKIEAEFGSGLLGAIVDRNLRLATEILSLRAPKSLEPLVSIDKKYVVPLRRDLSQRVVLYTPVPDMTAREAVVYFKAGHEMAALVSGPKKPNVDRIAPGLGSSELTAS